MKQVNLSQMSRKERREAENEVKLLQSLRVRSSLLHVNKTN